MAGQPKTRAKREAAAKQQSAAKVESEVQTIFRWKQDPVAFVRECLKAQPDPWQIDALNDYAAHQRIAMCASKGVGKSTVLAWVVWHFMATRYKPLVACTSISADNLRDGLWAELARWQQVSPLLSRAFELSKERIIALGKDELGNELGLTWYCSARNWSKTADMYQQSNTLAGLHAENLLFVVDEAGAIPDAVVAAAEAGLATVGGDKRLVLAGNPTNLDGPLYRACMRDAALWRITRISSAPDDPKRSTRVKIEWAQEQIRIYGRDNPWVLVNVFGQFPPSSMNSLVGPAEVEAAFTRAMTLNSQDSFAILIGVDVARFGDDRTVIVVRQGRAMRGPPIILRGADTVEVAGRVAKLAAELRADAVFVDATGGHGVGVIDILRQAHLRVLEVHFSGSPNDPTFFNKRSEIWWLAADWVKQASLPLLPDIVREFCEPTYSLQGGKLRLEEKEQIKSRLGYSPDIVDALACTFSMPIMPTERPDPMDRWVRVPDRVESQKGWRERFLTGGRAGR